MLLSSSGWDGVVTVGIPRVEYLEVLLGTQQVSCDGTLEYFTYIEVPKMSFGEESTRIDKPNFPPQRFLTKAVLTARRSRQRQKNDGLD
jgi:hypothetical protein